MDIGTLCSGAGVGVLGVGTKIWGVESNAEIAAVYNRNYPSSEMYCTKVQNISDTVLKAVDCIVATPPCQNASKLTKAIESNADRELSIAIADIVRRMYPSIFVLENVPGYRKFKSFEYIHKVMRNFYNVAVFTADMQHYGFSQCRNRLYLVASKKSIADMPNKRSPVGWMSALNQCIADMPVTTFSKNQLDFKGMQGMARRYGARKNNNRLYLPDEPSFTIRACSPEHWYQASYINGDECRAISPSMLLRLFGDVELADRFLLPEYKPLAMTCVGNALSYGMLKLIINSVTGYTV